MRNITLRADERDIEADRAHARAERTTLNALFREWLRRYLEPPDAERFDSMMERFEAYAPGRKFTREEMNES